MSSSKDYEKDDGRADRASGIGGGILTSDGPLGMRGISGIIANMGIVGAILLVFIWQQQAMMTMAAADRTMSREANATQWEVMRQSQVTLERLTRSVVDNQEAISRQTRAMENLAQEIRSLSKKN